MVVLYNLKSGFLVYISQFLSRHSFLYTLSLIAGLRGAIPYALVLNLEFSEEKRYVLVTSTLVIVLFTIVVLGGLTLPMVKVSSSLVFLLLECFEAPFSGLIIRKYNEFMYGIPTKNTYDA